MKYIRAKNNSVLIDIHVVPNAKVTAIVGEHGDALKVRVAAPPVDGAANTEICRFFAKLLGVPKSTVTIVCGETSKAKTVGVVGGDLASVRECVVGALRD
jgi:uncharacterized protein